MKSQSTVSRRNKMSSAIEVGDPPFHFPFLREIMPFLNPSAEEPSACDCEDLSMTTYHRAAALVDIFESAETGAEAERSDFFLETKNRASQALNLQIEIGRLAAATLYKLYRRDSHDSDRSR